ncbi:MAG TPA: FAD-dependent oxidoreductase [Streptosporangiaceae bacterium]
MTTMEGRDSFIGLPGDKAYAAATSVFNLAAPVTPTAAVTAQTIDQIRAAIRYADTENVPIRVHTTGHGAPTARPMSGALLIRADLDGGVEVDAARRLVRIAAGTRWGAVIDAAAAHGLAAPHGSSPTVGVVGYLLRGGVSCYGRRVGVAASSVRAIELVTADGELRRADASCDRELLWALRGGGGGFGVVTSVELALFPAATVVTGAAYWPAAHAERLLSIWRRWTLEAPDEATTTLRVLNLPKVPEVPAVLCAGTVVCVDGAVLSPTGDPSDAQRYADDLLRPMRAVAEPILDTWQLAAPPAAAQAHVDPVDPLPIYSDHLLLDEMGDEGAAAFLRVAGPGSGSVLTNAELRQLGGALSAAAPEAGVLGQLDARYAYIGSGVPFGPVSPDAIMERCAVVRAALGPWDTGKTAPTFVGSLEQPQQHLSRPQVLAVDRVRARVDPSGRFRADIAPGSSERLAQL